MEMRPWNYWKQGRPPVGRDRDVALRGRAGAPSQPPGCDPLLHPPGRGEESRRGPSLTPIGWPLMPAPATWCTCPATSICAWAATPTRPTPTSRRSWRTRSTSPSAGLRGSIRSATTRTTSTSCGSPRPPTTQIGGRHRRREEGGGEDPRRRCWPRCRWWPASAWRLLGQRALRPLGGDPEGAGAALLERLPHRRRGSSRAGWPSRPRRAAEAEQELAALKPVLPTAARQPELLARPSAPSWASPGGAGRRDRRRQGRVRQGRRHLELGVRFEDALVYTEPSESAFPLRHALAAVLLEAGRPAEAETVYWEDLKRNRENGWALTGLALALRAQKKEPRPT